MERWRVTFAIVAALASLPLLAIDNVSSTDAGEPDSLEAAAARAWDDPGIARLAVRAGDWATLREDRRVQALDEATAIANRAVEAEAVRLEAVAREAEEALRRAEAAEKEQASERAAAAVRKAQAAARQAAEARAAQQAAAAKAAEQQRAAKRASGPAAPPATPRAGEPTAEQWAKLRACESGGNYGAVSSGGRFRGGYQFDQSTWDHVAAQAAPALIGVDPATAAPADQDSLALALYRMRGASPWPRCGAALR